MAQMVIPDLSPSDLLSRLRGQIVDARPTYPERMRLEIDDVDGARWRFVTHFSDYAPADPDALRTKTVVDAKLDRRSGDLAIALSDGSAFEVTCVRGEDELPSWRLFTPEGLTLTYGPGPEWKLGRATDPC